MNESPKGYAVEVIRGARLHCGFWHYPAGKQPCDDEVPCVRPLNAVKKPPLVFATAVEAEVAVDFFKTLWDGRRKPNWRADVYPGEYWARVKGVNKAPTHVLTDNGFQPLVSETDFFYL